MSRIFSILWTVGLSGQVLAGAPGDAAPEVTIEVTGIASSHGLDRVTLSRLLAWKKGELCRAQGYGFSVGRIVSGKLYDPGYPDRPVGTNHLDVILVDDALNALRAPGGRGARGTWTLTELPDGQYVVSDVEDTPMRGLDVGSKKKQADEIEKALRSGVPEQQLQALDRLEEVNCLCLIPAVIDLLDSQETVSVTNQDPRGRPFTRKVAMRNMAELVLKAIAQPLAGRDRPRGTSIAAWESWWKELLGTDPFPAVDIAPGGVRPVARLAMNQTHPEVSASPAGNRVVISVSRLEQPEHGVRSGIRLIEPGAPREDDFVYKLADCEPDSLAVGWDGVSAAVVWQECRYGPPRGARVKFMLLDDAKRKGEPVRLKLRRVDHMKIAPFRKNTWLLAAAVDPKPGSDGDIEEWKRAVTLFVLSAKGRVIRSVPRVQLPKNPAYGMRDGVVINAVAVTSRGPALAVNIPEEGLYLIFLDWKLRTRRSVQVNDPANDGHEFSAGLGVNGDKLCVAWRESDNHDDRLFVRTFDANGTPLSAGHLLSSYAGILADPIAAGDGFEIIWTDFSQTRNQVRIATVHAGGKPTASRCVHISRDWISVLGAGHANGVTRVFARDTQYYPHWLWQKDVSTDPK